MSAGLAGDSATPWGCLIKVETEPCKWALMGCQWGWPEDLGRRINLNKMRRKGPVFRVPGMSPTSKHGWVPYFKVNFGFLGDGQGRNTQCAFSSPRTSAKTGI